MLDGGGGSPWVFGDEVAGLCGVGVENEMGLVEGGGDRRDWDMVVEV